MRPVVASGRRVVTGSPNQTRSNHSYFKSNTLPLVPVKLVKRILKGDMAEFLKDNMEVERRRALAEPGTGQSLRAHHPQREVPDVLSWLRCFSIYAAVICSKWPEKKMQLFAYQEMILREARRGGKGWLMYDSAFRQQITSLDTFDFSTINQSLYSTTCLQLVKKFKACVFCGMSDHKRMACPYDSVPRREAK